MSFRQWYFCSFMALFMGFGLVNSEFHQIPEKRLTFYQTITVDESGHGDFSTIQSAIDSIPSDNTHWICIYIKTGVYREKVTISSNKPYIMLKGDGKNKTRVVWDDHATLAQSPTLTVLADNFIAKSMSFTNSYNFPWFNNANPRVPAVAALIAGDKCSFYRCAFLGVQDTLWDCQGRHYFRRCSIVGAVDFIFGTGQSIYDRCTISVNGRALDQNSAGYITAQGRSNPNDGNGFVFKDCKVIGRGLAYLGRPWRDYARVLFYNTSMSNIIQPQGWFVWNMAGLENQLTLSEYGCHGLGSDMSQRVAWEKKLGWEAVKQLTSMSFIDTEGWLHSQPFSIGWT